MDAVHAVLDLLHEHDLYLKLEKCVWEAASIDYLGVILEKGMTRMDPTKFQVSRTGQFPKQSQMYAPSWASVISTEHLSGALPTSHDP